MKSFSVCQRLCGAWLNVRYSHCLIGKSCIYRKDGPFLWLPINSNSENKEISSKSIKDKPSRSLQDNHKYFDSSIVYTDPTSRDNRARSIESAQNFCQSSGFLKDQENLLDYSRLIESAQNFCQSSGFLKDQENLLEYSRSFIDKSPSKFKQPDLIATKLLSSKFDAVDALKIECCHANLLRKATSNTNPLRKATSNANPLLEATCNDNHLRKATNITYFKTVDTLHYADANRYLDTYKFASNRQNRKKSSDAQIKALETIPQQIMEQLPWFFIKGDDFSKYNQNVILHNHILRVKTRGLRKYKMQVQFYRWMKKLFWSDLTIDIIKITKDTDDHTIKVRWQVRGLPNYYIPFLLLARGERQRWYRYGDYFSILHVGESGLVEKHDVMNMQPRSLKQKAAALLSFLPFILPDFNEEPVLPSSILPDFNEEPVLPSSSNKSTKVVSSH